MHYAGMAPVRERRGTLQEKFKLGHSKSKEEKEYTFGGRPHPNESTRFGTSFTEPRNRIIGEFKHSGHREYYPYRTLTRQDGISICAV